MNKYLQSRVSDKALGMLARAHGVGQFVIPQHGTKTMSERMRATAVEAVLGAVIKDNGYDCDVLKRVVAAFGII